MKIACTISDFGAAANIGGNVENTTVVIEIPEDCVPEPLRSELSYREEAKEKDAQVWTTLSFSLMQGES